MFTKTIDSALPNISLEADFIVSNEVIDDFGRKAKPSTTYLTYKIELKYVVDGQSNERIELISEHLTYLPKSSAKKRIGFNCSKDFSILH